jgi:hypothetical protein
MTWKTRSAAALQERQVSKLTKHDELVARVAGDDPTERGGVSRTGPAPRSSTLWRSAPRPLASAMAAGKTLEAWDERVSAIPKTTQQAVTKLIRADHLIIIDDVGLLPVSPEAAEALFRVVDAAYERRSIALTSNMHPAGFDELMPKTLAAATVDRLLHHAHVLLTEGTESYRLTQATAG